MRTVMTVLGLFLVLAPWRAAAQGVPEVPEIPTLPRDPEIVNYRLSMEKIRQLVEVQRRLNELGTSDPKLLQQVSRDNDAPVEGNQAALRPAEAAAVMDKYPALRAVFTRAGTTSRDYMAAMGAVGNAMLQLEIKLGRLNPLAAPPPETAAEKANLALLEKNQAEWGKIKQELEQLWENSPWMME